MAQRDFERPQVLAAPVAESFPADVVSRAEPRSPAIFQGSLGDELRAIANKFLETVYTKVCAGTGARFIGHHRLQIVSTTHPRLCRAEATRTVGALPHSRAGHPPTTSTAGPAITPHPWHMRSRAFKEKYRETRSPGPQDCSAPHRTGTDTTPTAPAHGVPVLPSDHTPSPNPLRTTYS